METKFINKVFHMLFICTLVLAVAAVPNANVSADWPFPVFMLNVDNDSSWHGLDAWNWPLGAQVTLSVDDPHTLQNPDYTEMQTMAEPNPGGSTISHAMYMQDNNFEGHPGFSITLSDGVQTKTMIVPLLQGTKYDVEADTISGVTDPFARVVVACDVGAEPTVTADSNGNWIANFRDPQDPNIVLYDIQPGTWCEPQMQVSGNEIVLRAWWAPNLRIDARFHQNEIYGYDWPLGNLVTLTIDDPDNGVSMDYTDTQTVVELSDVYPHPTLVRFELGNFHLENGQIVTMSDGAIIKTHVVAVPIISGSLSWKVEGLAGPHSEIWVEVAGATRHETADATGHWLANFYVPGDEDFEIQTANIGWFTQGEARFQDNDGDSTSTNWGRGILMIELDRDGRPRDLYIRAWPGRSLVSTTIDNPATPQTPDYTDIRPMNWSDGYSHMTLDWTGIFDVQPGFTITVSDGYITKSMLVPRLTVTGYDLVNDTISGRSDPLTTVVVPISNADGSKYAERSVVADNNGNWLANFAVSNNSDETLYDVQPGDSVEAQTYEADWDHTVLRDWSIPTWVLKGFYQPVDMNGIYNLVKGGSTVPFKFEVFAGSIELTDIADIESFTYTQIACDTSASTDSIETTVTGGNSLRYDPVAGQFTYNWKTPNIAGKCYRVAMTTVDGSSLVAYFKLK